MHSISSLLLFFWKVLCICFSLLRLWFQMRFCGTLSCFFISQINYQFFFVVFSSFFHIDTSRTIENISNGVSHVSSDCFIWIIYKEACCVIPHQIWIGFRSYGLYVIIKTIYSIGKSIYSICRQGEFRYLFYPFCCAALFGELVSGNLGENIGRALVRSKP